MHGQFGFCCDRQPSFRKNIFLILVIIIFQLFKACYSVQEYIYVIKHTIIDNGTKKLDQNASFMMVEPVNYNKMNPVSP